SAPAPSPAASAPSPAASAVTEWAVAPIPSDEPGDAGPAASAPVAQLAVDDEPEEVSFAAARVATLAPARDGEIVAEPGERPEDADDADVDVLGPGTAAPASAAAEPSRPITTLRAADGVQRYGEAVVRQILGATFVREEPYDPPTRFQ
ncbi:MAG: DNA polymerase III subunit gamma and tau, partial [Microbacterium sp.]